jgi:hypothetical protein
MEIVLLRKKEETSSDTNAQFRINTALLQQNESTSIPVVKTHCYYLSI